MAHELSSKDQRINSEAKLLNDLSISLKQAEDYSNNLKRKLKMKRISIETIKISNDELEAKMIVAEEELRNLRKEVKDAEEKGLKDLQALENETEIVLKKITENDVKYNEAKTQAEMLKLEYENNQDEVADLDALISDLDNEILNLDDCIEKKHQEHEELLKTEEALTLKAKEVEALKGEYHSLKTVLQEEEIRSIKLQSDVDSLLAIDIEKNALDEHNLNLCNEIRVLEKEIQEKTSSLQELKESIKDNDNQIHDEECKRANFSKVLAKLQVEIGELERSIEDEKDISLLDSEAELSNKVATLDTEILSIEENLQTLNLSVAASIEENKNVEEEISKVSASKEALQSEFDDLKMSYDNSLKQLEAVDDELATFGESSNDSSATIKESKKKLKALDTKHSKLTKESSKLQKDLDKKSKIVADYNQELASIDLLLSESLDRVTTLEEEIETTKSLIESNLLKEETIASNKELINSLNEEITKEEKNLVTKQRSLTSAKKNSDKFSKQLERSTSALDDLKNQAAALSKSLEDGQKTKEALNEEIKALESQLTPDLVLSQGNEFETTILRFHWLTIN